MLARPKTRQAGSPVFQRFSVGEEGVLPKEKISKLTKDEDRPKNFNLRMWN
jgi:hypothetical protein